MPAAPIPTELNAFQRGRLQRFGASQCVDIHCHILPGLDDGPATLDESIALARALVRDGITRVIATPHQLGRYDRQNVAATVRASIVQVQSALDQKRIPLSILPGGEVRIDERLPQLLEQDAICTLGDHRRYLLLELPSSIAISIEHVARLIQQIDVKIVLAHCERYEFFHAQPGVLEEWMELGVAMQVNAGSLMGAFGKPAQSVAIDWIRRGWVSIIASDAHSTGSRRPRISEVIDFLSPALGDGVVRRMCIDNPQRIATGEDLI